MKNRSALIVSSLIGIFLITLYLISIVEGIGKLLLTGWLLGILYCAYYFFTKESKSLPKKEGD